MKSDRANFSLAAWPHSCPTTSTQKPTFVSTSQARSAAWPLIASAGREAASSSVSSRATSIDSQPVSSAIFRFSPGDTVLQSK